MKRNLVFGVGINDANYIVGPTINGKQVWCEFYTQWTGMIKRCYSDHYHKLYPTYKECSVCEEWLLFSAFKNWMETQDWQGKDLDKDILIEGNKIYSPEGCVFVDHHTNNLLLYRSNYRGKYPLGVYFHKSSGLFRAKCRNGNGEQINISSHSTDLEAHHEYLKFKIEVIKNVASRQLDSRVKESLLRHSSKMKQAILNNHEYLTV